MRSSTGRPVSGADFFDREAELKILEDRVCDFNHVLLTGQRRMGKTSVTRETSVEDSKPRTGSSCLPMSQGAACPGGYGFFVAAIAEKVHVIRPIAYRFAATMQRWLETRIEEVSAYDFRVRIRAGLDSGNWRRHGEQLLHECAHYDAPVLLVRDPCRGGYPRRVHRGRKAQP